MLAQLMLLSLIFSLLAKAIACNINEAGYSELFGIAIGFDTACESETCNFIFASYSELKRNRTSFSVTKILATKFSCDLQSYLKTLQKWICKLPLCIIKPLPGVHEE